MSYSIIECGGLEYNSLIPVCSNNCDEVKAISVGNVRV